MAGVFTTAILWFNVADLWHLVSTSDIGRAAIIVFWVLNGIVSAGVQFGVSVMLMADRADGGNGPQGGRGISVRVAATATPARSKT